MIRDPIIKQMSNLQFSAESFVMEMMRQPLSVQERWWETILAYTYGMAAYYDYGWFPNNTQEIARQCHGIVHTYLGAIPKYAQEAEAVDLSAFDGVMR